MICSSNFRISSFVPKDNMGISQIPTNKTSTLKKGKKKKQPQKSSLTKPNPPLFYRILPGNTAQPSNLVNERCGILSTPACLVDENQKTSATGGNIPWKTRKGLVTIGPLFLQKRNCVDIRERSCSEWFWEGWKIAGMFTHRFWKMVGETGDSHPIWQEVIRFESKLQILGLRTGL